MTGGDRVTVLALVDGRSTTHGATIVHRDQTMLHVSSDGTLPLPIGEVVGLMAASGPLDGGSDGTGATVALALVTESIGPTVTVLRVLERRA